MVLLSESDDLQDTYRRLGKQEREADRQEAIEEAERAGREYLPHELVGTKHAASGSWKKHPSDV